MSTPPITYPLDLTGTSTDNLVLGEEHSLANAPNRAFVPSYGPFFTRSMVVRALPSGDVLTKDVQYKAVQLFTDATMRAGDEICAVVVITDESLGSDFSMDYQVLGGEFSSSVYAIEQMIDALQIDDRSVKWGAILGKPEEFAPAPHLHDLGDLYGFEYITVALEQIRQAILIGDEASHAAIYQYVDHQDDLLRTDIDAAGVALTQHTTNYDNPHHVTASQVGLSNVDNFATASSAQGTAGTATNLFMTPAATKAAITSQAGSLLQAHVNDHSNPHVVTASQVGLGSVGNYEVASQAQAEAGTSNTLYMTPLRTAQEITVQALVPLNAHIANTSNPHQVTKTQVGLGSVANYGIASTSDATAGVSNTLYMTPALTAAAITSQAGALLQAHVNNHNNPHAVTKAQLGLSNVQNYGIASQAQAQVGSDNATYMTPLRTAQAIATQALSPLNSHIANHSNPHAVTAGQVGAYTTGQIDSKISVINSALNGKQANLGFIPVQQSGGSGQLSNKIYIGHTGSGPSLQVDTTNFGPFSFLGHHHAISDINDLQNQLNQRPITSTVANMIAAAVGAGFTTGANHIRVANVLIQWGYVATNGSNNQTINFPHSYSSAPIVVPTPVGTGTGSPSSYCWDVAGITVGGFSTYNSGFGPSGITWISIGTTDDTAFNTAGTYQAGGGGTGGSTSGGGGGGGYGSCVTDESFMFDGDIAKNYDVHHALLVTDPYTDSNNSDMGEVLYAHSVLQPCVRIETADGAVLECSTTAPIPTKNLGWVTAPHLEGLDIATATRGDIDAENTPFTWSTVTKVTDIGMHMVRHIYAENRNFWASADGVRYILHHNLKQEPNSGSMNP